MTQGYGRYRIEAPVDLLTRSTKRVCVNYRAGILDAVGRWTRTFPKSTRG